jgi:hypothetical protein
MVNRDSGMKPFGLGLFRRNVQPLPDWPWEVGLRSQTVCSVRITRYSEVGRKVRSGKLRCRCPEGRPKSLSLHSCPECVPDH